MISDIRLCDGLVFEALTDVPAVTRIIFTTAYDQYALKAFDYNCIHYLLKPIDTMQLSNAIIKAFEMSPWQLNSIRSIFGDGARPLRKRFLVTRHDGIEIIKTEEINHISIENGIIYIFTKEYNYAIDIPIDACEKQLDPAKFFRANRQSIVNIDYIAKISNSWGRKAYLTMREFENKKFSLSREKYAELKKWLG